MSDKRITLKTDKNGLHFFMIEFEYDAQLVEFVRKIPTRKYTSNAWKIRADHVTAKYVEAFARKLDFEVDPSAKDYIDRMVHPVFAVEMPKLKRDLRHFQKEGVAYAVKYERCFIADEMGLGKAQSLDSKILTPFGWKLMRDIKIGDEIINSDGNISEVLGVYPQGIKDAYKITFSDGAETITSDNHLWSIQSTNHRFRNDKFSVKQLKEFKDDLFSYSAGRKNSKWFIPMSSPVNFKKSDVKIDAYLLGVLLGDGCITKSVRITSTDADMIDALKLVLDKSLQIRNTRKYEYAIIKSNTHKWYRNILISNLRDLNLYGHNAYNKFIPDAYKFNSIDIRISILQGLMDTDGYISSTGDNIQFHTSSEQLGQDVKFIVNSLGGTAKISSRIPTYIHKGIKKIGKKAYTLDINLPDSIIPFRLNRKICKLHKVKKYIPYRAFKSVEYIGQLPMQCIKTSSSDGLYVTDDCIVTHNSGESIAAVETLGAYPCLIICPASLKLNWKKEIALWLDKSVKVVDGLIKINYETIHGKKVVFGYETPDYNADFVIINYDILSREKKVVNAFKPDNIEIPNHKDLLKQVGFKSIIVDESHMCFPYNTMIQTKIGKLKIGDIVENKIDVPILSYDLKNKKLEYKKIEHFYTNGISKRTFLKIFHTYGYIILTDNHKIYVEGKGYVKASEIKKNDRVRILPQYIREQTERENTTEVLFEEMCNCNDTEFTGNNKQNERSEKTIGEKNLSCVSEGIPIVFDRKNFKKKNLLFKQLRNKIKMVRFKFCRKNKKSSEQVIGAFIENDKKGSYVKSSVGNRNFESNEIKQFDEKGGNQEKSFSKITRKDIFIKRLKSNWTNYTTIKISNGIRSIIGGFRIYYNNWKCKIIFQISSKFLSGGHCISKDKSGHRSRWKRTQSKEMEIFRPKKNGNFEFSWVEGIEILEQRDYGQYGISEKKDRIYNLEINKNNNYFAENILVSNCSNHKSLRTKAVKEISRKIRYRYALSGTPILNRPKELIAQLDFLDRLETLGGFWTFAKRYCSAFEGPFGWDFSGASNLDELHENMKKTCFIRRKKEDVLEELPPKQRIFLPVELSNLKEYENASKNFRNWMKMNMMNELEYYEELKNTTLLTDSQRKMIATVKVTQKLNKTLAAEALVKIEKLKQVVARGKLLKVYEFIDNFLLYDEKLLIFAKHKEIYDKLIDKYKDISVHIIGGMTSKQKDKSVEEFQNNPNVKLFIGALDAAGVGLNLTQSSTVAFVELGWTSAIHDQAEDRAHRIGQKDFVKCYYFYTEKTIDEQILELIEKKRNITANISDGITIPQDSASNDDITEILSKFI